MPPEHLISELLTTDITYTSAAIRLVISFLLGAIIGIERQQRRQSAGMRTMILICVGSAAAMLLSLWVPQSYPHLNADPGRIAAQILTGIGFLGAGTIVQSNGSVRGLTTAACIWVIAIIGMCVGAGLYIPAAILTFITLFILIALERIENKKRLSGEIKQLKITFSTDTPDIDLVMSTIKSHQLFIINISSEKHFEACESILLFRVQTRRNDTFEQLFNDIHTQCPQIKSIGMYDL